MPKQTFYNLSDKKREKLLEAALCEFSTKGYHGASLTQLVKTLGIAKGSLYQYFENKESIYAFLVEEACNRRLSFFKVLEGKPVEDYLFNYLLISLKFDATYPYLGCMLYNGLSSMSNKIVPLIQDEFCNKVPQHHLANGISMLCAALANFAELASSRQLNLNETISNYKEIPVSSEEIIKIVQNNIIRI